MTLCWLFNTHIINTSFYTNAWAKYRLSGSFDFTANSSSRVRNNGESHLKVFVFGLNNKQPPTGYFQFIIDFFLSFNIAAKKIIHATNTLIIGFPVCVLTSCSRVECGCHLTHITVKYSWMLKAFCSKKRYRDQSIVLLSWNCLIYAL